MSHPLIDEAMKKAAVAWVAVGGGPARLLWCLAHEGALWVVTGPGEQGGSGAWRSGAGDDSPPELAPGAAVRVTLRGDHGGRIVTWPAAVTRIDPQSPQWAEVVPQLAGKRLNVSGDAESLMARWAAECTVVTLTPAGDPVEANLSLPDPPLRDGETAREPLVPDGNTLPDASLAEPPRDTPVRRRPRMPYRLHRVRRP